MNMLSSLRTADVKASGNVRARLSCLGYQPQENRIHGEEVFLRFLAEFEDGSEMSGYIGKISWLKQGLPDLQGIDWLSMDEQILPLLMAEVPLQLALNFQHAPFTRCRIIELADDTGQLSLLPCLSGANGDVIVEKIIFPNGDVRPESSDQLEIKLPVPLTFRLGTSRLPVAALSTVNAGDVLLIERVNGLVRSHGKTLFKFELERESIMIVKNNDDFADEGLLEVSQEAEGINEKNGINELPVELSFVLLEKTISLAELKGILPGEILQLPLNALMDVEIRANQRAFARGELIQLSDGQLGVEVRKIWS